MSLVPSGHHPPIMPEWREKIVEIGENKIFKSFNKYLNIKIRFREILVVNV